MSADTKPGEKVLVEGVRRGFRGTHVRVEFLNADGFAVDLYLKPADVHRASDFLRPKFRVGDKVFPYNWRPIKVVDRRVEYRIVGDSRWWEEDSLQPAPVKTPLDDAREQLERGASEGKMVVLPNDSCKALLNRLAELERKP